MIKFSGGGRSTVTALSLSKELGKDMFKKLSIALLVTAAVGGACGDKKYQKESSDLSVFSGKPATDRSRLGVFFVYGGCSAVLVGKGQLLTAGHCFYFESDDALLNPRDRKVFYESNSADYSITRIQKAPFKLQNQLRLHPSDYNKPGIDLALIDFDDRGEIPESHVQKIVGPNFDVAYQSLRQELTVAGYGWVDQTLSNVDENKTVPRRLQEGSMYWVSRWGIQSQEIYMTGPSNICQGDSGGPVFLNGGDRRLLVGINIATSTFYLRNRCAVDDSIATNLGHPSVRSWISKASGNQIPLD